MTFLLDPAPVGSGSAKLFFSGLVCQLQQIAESNPGRPAPSSLLPWRKVMSSITPGPQRGPQPQPGAVQQQPVQGQPAPVLQPAPVAAAPAPVAYPQAPA